MTIYALPDPAWLILDAKSNRGAFECAEAASKRYGMQVFVPTGRRVPNVRKALIEGPNFKVDPVAYPVFGNTVFVYVQPWDWQAITSEYFNNTVGAHGFRKGPDDLNIRVPPRDIRELAQRQQAKEWDCWLTRAIQHFETRIHTPITVPNGTFKGATAKIVGICGSCVRWQIEILGKQHTGLASMKRLWPDEDMEMHIFRIELACGVTLIPKTPGIFP